jgi:large subunit ribosomal protein L2
MTTIEYKKFITTNEPYKPLTSGFKRDVGRNNYGRVTMRNKGGGQKRLFRDVDFMYDKKGMVARVETVEYDPNRSGFIALIKYQDGERRYILAPKDLAVGASIIVSEKAPLTLGNRLPLSKIPVGTFVYNVEMKAGGGAKIARGAGVFAQVVANDAGYVHIKMPSTEIRKVPETAWASIGSVSNEENRLVVLGKAGRSRWFGIRPRVRGSAQNPVDHPYGGGEGRQGRGLRRAKTRWGKPAGKGQKTRTPKKYSNVFILSRCQVGKQKKVE